MRALQKCEDQSSIISGRREPDSQVACHGMDILYTQITSKKYKEVVTRVVQSYH